MDPLYACSQVSPEGICTMWQHISMPASDPSIWGGSFTFGFVVVWGLFATGLVTGYVVQLISRASTIR